MTNKNSFPAYIVHASDVPEEECRYPAPAEHVALSFGRNLGKAAGSVNIGMWLERLPPGRRTSMTHAHSAEEELVYILEGECVARIKEPGLEAQEFNLRTGHTVSFPAAMRIAHSFWNQGTKDCLLLCVGERKPDADRVCYPEDETYDRHVAVNRPERYWKEYQTL